MSLSRTDLPRIIEALRKLVRALENPTEPNLYNELWVLCPFSSTVGMPPSEPNPSLMIGNAMEHVLRSMVPLGRKSQYRPLLNDIEQSPLDLEHKAKLLDIKDLLTADFASLYAYEDRSRWIREILNAIEVLGGSPPSITSGKPTKQKRRKGAERKPRRITERQLEALQLYGELGGSYSKVGQRMAITRQAAESHVKKALSKTSKAGLNPKLAVRALRNSKNLPHDRRGQVTVPDRLQQEE